MEVPKSLWMIPAKNWQRPMSIFAILVRRTHIGAIENDRAVPYGTRVEDERRSQQPRSRRSA